MGIITSAALSRKCSSEQKARASGYFSWMTPTMKCSSVCFRSVDFVSDSLRKENNNNNDYKSKLCSRKPYAGPRLLLFM
ncbi:hypothetical protein EYF80_057139 [Liparis tanakae]|uniref:Uncharacterized protein n=1 Tax=Liparis tanakae TaxID=230148 RepID=A0A4Z2EVW9_9TELE|nr:hypothetical protein EYF80_057139 [Liparis tanakae]